MNVCLSIPLAASLENASVGEVAMQGPLSEQKLCKLNPESLICCWDSPCTELVTPLEMSYWLGNGFCLSAVYLELWSNVELISKQDLKEQVSTWHQLREMAAPGLFPSFQQHSCLNQRCRLQACSGHAVPCGSLPRCELRVPVDSDGFLLANRLLSYR